MKYKLDELYATPFNRLESFLANKIINSANELVDLSIGQPYHPMPKIMFDTLYKNESLWNKYPPVNATNEYRKTVSNWLEYRYGLPQQFIDDNTVLPLSGTREGLFTIVQAVDAYKGDKKPLKVAMPNPCFQTYQAAVAMCGGTTIPLDAYKEDNFLPSLDFFTQRLCKELTLLYVCTPTNPQGMFASYDYIKKIIRIAQKYDFTIVFDHCYSEIYIDTPPVGVLEVVYRENMKLDNIIVMHSLSKRSNVAGLRTGFVVGDPNIIKLYSKIRSYSCAGMPIPIVEATIALLKDEFHVVENRLLYKNKFIAAKNIFSDYTKFLMPQGGIFLWLEVNDAEQMCAELWRQDAIKVLPGNFMTLSVNNTVNHGKKYIRIAMVPEFEVMVKALTKIRHRIRLVDGI